jgi:multidrug efflux pump subunit AcrA (membrane-fusion protein)
MFATGKVVVGLVTGVIAVPEAAIRRDGDRTIVFVYAEGRLQRRAVTVGLTGSEDDMAEIRAGLSEGDVVVVAPFINLTDGMAARLAGGA